MFRNIPTLAALLAIVSIGAAQAASTYTIKPSHNRGGTTVPDSTVTVDAGASQPFTATADDGFYVADIKLDGKSVTITKGASAEYTILAVDKNHRIAARFAADPVIVARSNRGGTITPKGKVQVPYGGAETFTIAPDTGYHIGSVKLDGVSQGEVDTLPITDVIKKHTVVANFVINRYEVTTQAGANGTIKPASATVKHGGKKVFTVVPDAGYRLASLTVNGEEQGNLPAKGKYLLKLASVEEDTAIVATFEEIVIVGMQIGSQVSVVDAQPEALNARPLSANSIPVAAQAQVNPVDSLPPDSDYLTDPTRVYVHEKAGDVFKTVNQILCMIDQTQYADSTLLNQDWYKVMVDKSKCEGQDSTDNSSASSQAGTSASDGPSYDTWTVKSERTTDSSSQILSAFIHTTGGPGDMPMTIRAKMTITEAASEANPLGLFSMTFMGSPESGPGAGQPVMRGVLKTVVSNDKVIIKFAEQEGPDGQPGHVAKAAFVKDDVNNTGYGSAFQAEPREGNPFSERVNFAYDDTHFLRAIADGKSQPLCLNRNSFESSAWRYGVYDALDGSRINLNGGFPINTQSDGKGAYGYLGYHGLHLPPQAQALQDGDSIYRMTWGENGPSMTPYTLFLKSGKLKKHVRSVITLDDIKNIPLEGNIPVPGSNQPGNTMHRVTWDGAQLAAVAQATMNPNGPPAWSDLLSPDVIDSNRTLPYSILGLYSQALGGQLNIELANCQPVEQFNPGMGVKCDTPTGTTPVIFYRESLVTPAEAVSATLSCYDNCPKAGANGMDGSNQETMVYPRDFNPGANNRHDYGFSDMLLLDGLNPVILASSNAQQWGFNSGPLFEANETNLAALACDWDANQTCGWKAWNVLSEFYTWETGPNSWNRYTSAKEGENFVVFDEPWQVAFSYPVDGTDGTNAPSIDTLYGGTKFFLQYSGFGDLHGIPGKCIDPATNLPVMDCSQPGLRWVPEFTIPAGSLVTRDSTDYLVKPLEMEQRMSKADTVDCSTLATKDMRDSWPDLKTDWVNPGLATEPEILDPPKVVGGVIQATQP